MGAKRERLCRLPASPRRSLRRFLLACLYAGVHTPRGRRVKNCWHRTRPPKAGAAGPLLVDVGAPLRSTAAPPRANGILLPGSTPVMRAKPGPKPAPRMVGARPAQPAVVQVLPSQTHDARVQCAPGAQPFGAGFAAAGIGHDIQTGRPWRRR